MTRSPVAALLGRLAGELSLRGCSLTAAAAGSAAAAAGNLLLLQARHASSTAARKAKKGSTMLVTPEEAAALARQAFASSPASLPTLTSRRGPGPTVVGRITRLAGPWAWVDAGLKRPARLGQPTGAEHCQSRRRRG